MLRSPGPSAATSRNRRSASPTPSPSKARLPPTTRSSRCSRNVPRVTTPKLPPPPRRPQSSSEFSSLSARTTSPAGVTSSAAIRLSQVSPNWAVRWPIPPPRVRPVTPVEPTTPPGVTRPWAWVAASKSDHVAPPCEIASPASGSTSTVRIRVRSITRPSSTAQWPAGLWPPPRTATSSSFSWAKASAAATSAASTQRAIAAGRRTTSRLKQVRAPSYSRSPGRSTSPVRVSRRLVEGLCHLRRPSRSGNSSIPGGLEDPLQVGEVGVDAASSPPARRAGRALPRALRARPRPRAPAASRSPPAPGRSGREMRGPGSRANHEQSRPLRIDHL